MPNQKTKTEIPTHIEATPKLDHGRTQLSWGDRCRKELGDYGLGIKDEVAGDSILGSRSGRRGMQRSGVRSLERRLPKIAAPRGSLVYAASGVVVSEASSGPERAL
jgi:hypothetical protein